MGIGATEISVHVVRAFVHLRELGKRAFIQSGMCIPLKSQSKSITILQPET